MSIRPERLERWVAAIFAREGLSASDSETVARVLVWANLRGMDTHGVVRVPRYVDLIRAGDLNPRPAMATRTETPSNRCTRGTWGFECRRGR
jgi:LDH2 family malate/lactate/ureidoglycolate dehydrogenase